MQTYILSNGKVKKVYLTMFLAITGFYIYYIGRVRLKYAPYILKRGTEYQVIIYSDLMTKLCKLDIDISDFRQRCKDKQVYQIGLSTDCDLSVSYVDKNRFDVILAGKKDIDNNDFRYRMKFGKFLSKLGYNSAMCEHYYNLFKPLKGTFEIVDGQKIPYWYDGNRYLSDCGTLNDSCMRNVDSAYFDIYVDNCEMLILKSDNNLLMGRALIWNTNIGKVLDRIYGSDDTILKFKQYATDNNISFKTTQNYSDKTGISVNGINTNTSIHVDLKYDISKYNYFPYMDTFTYLDDQTAYNTNRGDYCANNTDGTLEGYNDDNDDYVTDYNGDRQHIDDVTYVESRNEYYPNDDVVWCGGHVYLESECVNINGTWYHRDDDNIVWSAHNDKYIHYADAIYVEYEDDYFYDYQTVYIESIQEDRLKYTCIQDVNNDWQVKEDCIEIDNEWYHQDSEDIIQINSTWYLKDNCIEIDNEYYLADDENISFDNTTETYFLNIKNEIAC